MMIEHHHEQTSPHQYQDEDNALDVEHRGSTMTPLMPVVLTDEPILVQENAVAKPRPKHVTQL